MSKVILKVEIEKETYKQIKDDSVCSNNNECIISKSSSAFNALNAIINAIPITESDDAVSKKTVLEVLNKYGKFIFVIDNPKYTDMVDEVANLPSVLPKRKQGEWLNKQVTDDYHVLGTCSLCHERNRIGKACRSCGAEMR